MHTAAVIDDLSYDIGPSHRDGHVERTGKPQLVGTAMALHHDTIEPQKNSAVGGTRIELAAQGAQRAGCQKPANAPQKLAPQRTTQKVGNQLGCAFRRLQRDITREAIGYDDIDRAFCDVVAFDKSGKLDGQRGIVA